MKPPFIRLVLILAIASIASTTALAQNAATTDSRIVQSRDRAVIDADLDASRVRQLLSAAGVNIGPLTEGDAELAGAMRSLPGGRGLSLGDRCCLALTARSTPSEVLTADRAWSQPDLPIRVRLIR